MMTTAHRKRAAIGLISAVIACLPARAQYSTVSVNVGQAPGQVAINPVTNKVYVARDAVLNGAAWTTITAIDGATNATTAVTAGQNPQQIAVNPVTNKIYAVGGNVLTVIDGTTNATTSVPLGASAQGIAVNPVTNKIYVNCGSFVTVVDGATNVATSIAVAGGNTPEEILVNPVTNKIYVSSYTILDSIIPSVLSVIDGASHAVTPIVSGNGYGSFAINPVTSKIYVVGFGNNSLTVIDGVTYAATPLNVGPYPDQIAVNPVTNKVYIPASSGGSLTVLDGSTNAISTVAIGSGNSNYEIAVNPVSNKVYVDNTDSGVLTVVDGTTNATTAVTVASGTGSIAVNPVTNFAYLTATNGGSVTVINGNLPGAPTFTSEPESQSVNVGASVALDAVAGSAPSSTYRWFDNGVPLSDGAGISGSSTSLLYLSGAMTSANAGTYNCVATNASGTAASSNAVAVAVTSTTTPGRLVNLSSRASVGTGSNILISGFIVSGPGSKTMVLRGIGPGLSSLGIAGTLAAPTLSLFDGAIPSNLITQDTGWQNPPSAPAGPWAGKAQPGDTTTADFNQVGAFALASGSGDSSVKITLPSGNYTCQIAGANGGTGISLAEVYDADIGYPSAQLTNISSRGFVGTGGNVIIAGFVIGGSTSQTVLIRGSGPGLVPLGVTGTLPDPEIQLYRSNGDGTSTLLASNAGWAGNAQISATAASVGAFSWGTSATPDSAVLITLPPGPYTAQLAGAGGDTGIALVEVYRVP